MKPTKKNKKVREVVAWAIIDEKGNIIVNDWLGSVEIYKRKRDSMYRQIKVKITPIK